MLVFDVLGFVDSTRISTLCLASLHSVFVTRTRLYLVFTVPNMYVTLFIGTLCVHHLLSSMCLGFRVDYTLHVLDSMFIVALCSSSIIIYVLGV